MSWPVAVAGTVHRDDITTPRGSAESLGGSAVYFALAAARFTRVLLNGVVGADCYAELDALFQARDADLSGVARSRLPTFVWHAEHDFERWLTSSEWYEEGCEREWKPRLSPDSARAGVLFLASMRPDWQLALLAQSRAHLTAMDTMSVYTQSVPGRVRSVVEGCDLAFLNQAELRSLTGELDWETGARALVGQGRCRAVVVKRGPQGAAVVGPDSAVQRPAAHVTDVVDPTGAGDALAGGFLGYLAQREEAGEALHEAAVEAGLDCAAQTITTFGTGGLAAISRRQ